MRLKVIIGLVAIAGGFLLDYLPMTTAIMVYALIGVTLGAFSPKINRWSQQGLYNVVAGMVAAILIGQALPSFIDTAVEGRTGVDVVIIRLIPYIMRAALVWVALDGLVQKLIRVLRR